ncbi:MAG: fused MFS/spermidine synthase, partial [Pseudomonadota bacterium]
LLLELFLYAGLPFLLLASTAPLLQRWFASLGADRSPDPYFLYAASNAGSLAALACFPLLLERLLPISEQLVMWCRGFMVLALCVFACLTYGRARHGAGPEQAPPPVSPLVLRRVSAWLVYAAVPSSLTLGVTTHTTTDIAAVSWLWVFPLALYLGSYVIAFSALGPAAERLSRWLLPAVIAATMIVIFKGESDSLLQVPLNLASVAVVSIVLHVQLYRSRPTTDRLTTFYIVVAIGGLIGGSFNSLIAPLVFDSVIEFHLVLIVAVAIVERPSFRNFLVRFLDADWNGLGIAEIAMVLLVAATIGVAGFGIEEPLLTLSAVALMSLCIGACVYTCGFRTSFRTLAAVCLMSYLTVAATVGGRDSIFADRSFFGHFAVVEDNELGVAVRKLLHGTTLHGLQVQHPDQELTLQSYYAPIGKVLVDFLEARPAAEVAVIGLGTGNLACAGRPQDTVTFYEIDAKIERVAREYFTFLQKCPASTDVVIGDGRAMLSPIKDATFDVLVLDAFSGDAIPIHLLTVEAGRLYQRILKHDGLIVLHISNRYLNLRPVANALAEEVGWHIRFLQPPADPNNALAFAADFAVAMKRRSAAEFLDEIPAADTDHRTSDIRVWTDDYSSLWALLLP